MPNISKISTYCILYLVTILLNIFSIQTVYTQEADLDLTIGITGGIVPKYSGSNTNETKILPLVAGEYKISKNHSILFNPYDGLNYAYSANGKISYGVRLDYRNARNPQKSSNLAGMPKINTAFEAGPWIKYTNNNTSYIAVIGADVSGSHNGYIAELAIKQNMPINIKWQGDIGAALLFADSNYAQTYYGVTFSQVTATRPAYSAKGGLQEATLSSGLSYFINDKTFIRGDFGFKRLLGSAAKSPLSENPNQFLFYISAGYRF